MEAWRVSGRGWEHRLAQYCGNLRCLVKKFGFSLRETGVLSRENDVIRCMFLPEHPRNRERDRLEQAESSVGGLWPWAGMINF